MIHSVRRGTTQAIMDQKLLTQSMQVTDYWAFCWYPSGSGLDTARQLYLKSTYKRTLNGV
ncbi:MAG: hypothetical protein M9933_13070 [Chitinophagaceae bacterium]|nr:hypothetical protein [Chitinophagaceae bacterium]